MELPPFPSARATGWLAGFHWANPSTPLDAYCYVRRTVADVAAFLNPVIGPEGGIPQSS